MIGLVAIPFKFLSIIIVVPILYCIVASVTFDNEFAVHDIKVIESQNGLFIAMPSRKTPNGEFKDIAHPINPETREKIQKAILDAYENSDDATTTEGSAE